MQNKLSKRQRRKLIKEGVLNLVENQNNFGMTLRNIFPKTENQKLIFENFKNNNLFVHGSAGTGKTFVLLYLALTSLLDENSKYKSIKIFRSAVSTRNIGFLPGDVASKIETYEIPYIDICENLFNRGDAYGILKHKKLLDFNSTSFIRGCTYNDCIILVDECQNLSWHEFSSLMTRCGKNCKILFCGDSYQTDLEGKTRLDIFKMIDICQAMSSFNVIRMNRDDIVRSEFVKEFLIKVEEFKYAS